MFQIFKPQCVATKTALVAKQQTNDKTKARRPGQVRDQPWSLEETEEMSL